MTTVAAPIPTPPEQTVAFTKKKKSRSERKKAQRDAEATEKLKIVVRRLPPNLPEDIFWQSVGKWVTEETATWKAYYPGKFKTRCVSLAAMRVDVFGEVIDRRAAAG